jgi:hypothetical protein
MSDLAQLVFDLDLPQPAALSSYVPPGAARLLKALVVDGLDPQAIESAAALVVALDAGAVTS